MDSRFRGNDKIAGIILFPPTILSRVSLGSTKINISDYFHLRPVKSAKVSEISEATSASSLPLNDRVNFHIGHPVQDKRLSRLYFRLVSGLNNPPDRTENEEEIARLEDAGWEKDQVDPSNGTKFWTSCINLKIKQLIPPSQAAQFLKYLPR